MYWHKRCHESWFLKGDNNITFFHRVANERKRKQTIFFLSDGENRIMGDDKLLEYAIDYYKKLFGLGNGNSIDVGQDLWLNEDRVEDGEIVDLIRPFSKDEVKIALFQMEKNNVVGPDGLSIESYQKNWSIT
jgi:hypothetical protein